MRSNRRDSMSSVSISLGSPATSVSKSSDVGVGKPFPWLPLLEALDGFEVHPHDEVLGVHRRHLTVEFGRQRLGQRPFQILGRARLGHGSATARVIRRAGRARGMAAPTSIPSGRSRKKSKLKQKSKTRKSCLSSPGSEQISAQARAPPDHLPELDPRVDRLEEDEVGDLGHVDAGVEHVHGDGNVRWLILSA